MLSTGGSSATLAKVKREVTIVPDLIFAIEAFEASCSKLAKATGCSIVKGAKRTINRDFKFKQAPAPPVPIAVNQQGGDGSSKRPKPNQLRTPPLSPEL